MLIKFTQLVYIDGKSKHDQLSEEQEYGLDDVEGALKETLLKQGLCLKESYWREE